MRGRAASPWTTWDIMAMLAMFAMFAMYVRTETREENREQRTENRSNRGHMQKEKGQIWAKVGRRETRRQSKHVAEGGVVPIRDRSLITRCVTDVTDVTGAIWRARLSSHALHAGGADYVWFRQGPCTIIKQGRKQGGGNTREGERGRGAEGEREREGESKGDGDGGQRYTNNIANFRDCTSKNGNKAKQITKQTKAARLHPPKMSSRSHRLTATGNTRQSRSSRGQCSM